LRTIRGTVYVSRSEPLPEALVEVMGTGLKTTTNADGEFEIRDVPPATHVLKISFPGYKDVTRPVELVAGRFVLLKADLELDEQFGEEIVITGSKFGEKRLESPVTVESVSQKLLMQSGGTSYMAALSSMKGVDYADTSVNEKRISMRGFNTQLGLRIITMVERAPSTRTSATRSTPSSCAAGTSRRAGMFACVRCGGKRRVLAYVKAGGGVRAILEHLGLPTAGVSLAPAQESTQAAWC
jgi:hypothetical protein